MSKTIINLFFITLVWALTPVSSPCQELQIDHIILVDPELQVSIQDFVEKGFTVKKGTLHENGLRNAHIKFPNSSSIEVMSIEGVSNDEIAKTYDSLLEKKIKGAYIALTGLPIRRIKSELSNLNIEFKISESKLWSYISFPTTSEFAHIFFIIYHQDLSDQKEYTTHENGFNKIKSVKIEGTQTLIALLKRLGLQCEIENLGESKFRTNTGSILIKEIANAVDRPRINEIVLAKTNAGDTLRIVVD